MPQKELIHTEAVFASNLKGKKNAPHFSESPSRLAAAVFDAITTTILATDLKLSKVYLFGCF